VAEDCFLYMEREESQDASDPFVFHRTEKKKVKNSWEKEDGQTPNHLKKKKGGGGIGKRILSLEEVP